MWYQSLGGEPPGDLLNQLNGNCARSFFALPDLILDGLAFIELLNRSALYFGVVKKQVVPFSLNETKALF